MKKITFAIILLLPVLLFSKQSIIINPTEYDFGIMQSGESIKGNFNISNAGNNTINISIKPDCNCTIIENTEFNLAKGESITINYEIKTQKDEEGYISKNIIVYSNDKDSPVIYLVVKGNLEKKSFSLFSKIERRVNYVTYLDTNTLTSSNIASIFNFKHCHSCVPIINNILRWLNRKGNGIIINYYNLELNENKKNLEIIKSKLGYFPDLPILVYEGNYYCGKKQIEDLIKGEEVKEAKNILNSQLSILAIFLAGLLDGINPCAFTVIILLVSYLTLRLKSIKNVLLSGIIYIISVFVTYYLVGIGLFEFIKTITIFPIISFAFKYILSLALFILAILSLIDFIKAKQGKTEKMFLKLPDFLQNSIRKNIRLQMKDFNILIGSTVLGLTVSLFELVCTGQVYLPIIGYMVQNSNEVVSGLFFLLIYNIAFILPLVLVFILVFFGISNQKIGNIFSKNIAKVKLVFVFLFLIFGLITLVSIFY